MVTRWFALLAALALSCGKDAAKREPVPEQSGSASAADAHPPLIDAAAQDAAVRDPRRTWSFDGDKADESPSSFASLRTGPGKLGRWQVQRAEDAPSAPHVVGQLDPDPTVARFPLLVADSPSFRDGRVAVRCKAISGKVDQACGLVVRLVDERNYYVTRSNVLEDNIRLYHVVKGKRTELASYAGEVAQGWHELAFEVRGDLLRVTWDGTQVLEHRDTTFDKPGRAGMWTKADSITLFDDFTIESFDAPGTP